MRRVVGRLKSRRLAGFYTQEVRRAGGRRIGFEAIMLNGGSTMLASVLSRSRIRVGKYGVDLPRFEELIHDELHGSGAVAELIVIDEIGRGGFQAVSAGRECQTLQFSTAVYTFCTGSVRCTVRLNDITPNAV